MNRIGILTLLCCFIVSMSVAQSSTDPHDQPEELGQVSWHRSYETALTQAKKENKAVLILFQEVPGCATCRNYGHNVLTHPLMVEAIENEFVPLAIYNNRGGEDRKVLELYNEPTWNNPVVRIVDQSGKNLVDRVAGNYSAKGLYGAMKMALAAQKKAIPGYMEVLGQELGASSHNRVKETYYQMYCFWSGEGHLGKAEGVIATEPGFMSGHEVVKVKYDATVTSESELDTYAKQAKCSPVASKSAKYRPDKDPQYYLKHSAYKYLPLTPLQRSRINSALGKQGRPDSFLSPKQRVWLTAAKKGAKGEVLYTESFATAWAQLDR